MQRCKIGLMARTRQSHCSSRFAVVVGRTSLHFARGDKWCARSNIVRETREEHFTHKVISSVFAISDDNFGAAVERLFAFSPQNIIPDI